MTTAATTWQNTVIACQHLGAELVILTSLAQNRWVYEYFRSKGLVGNSIWIGLNDIAVEGSYRWLDGTNISHFHNWAPNQPDNAGNNENCDVLLAGNNGQWNDYPCANGYVGLCEQNSSIKGKIDEAFSCHIVAIIYSKETRNIFI